MNRTKPASSAAEATRVARTIAAECVASRARRLGRVLSRLYNDALRPHGLTAAQLNLMVGIQLMKGASASDIGRALELERSTLSRNLHLLKANEWVTVEPLEGGVENSVELTADGRHKLVDAYPTWRRAQREARRLLGEATFTDLGALFQ